MRTVMVLFLLFNLVFAQPEDYHKNYKKLIDTEIAFSELCGQKGINVSFLANFSDNGVVFRPEPVRAKDFYSRRKENGVLLKWKPVWAEVSAAGDLGYTTGPWELQIDTIKGWGQFVSVWQKQKDDTFKLLVDVGIDHDKINYDSLTLIFPKENFVKKDARIINVNDSEKLDKLDTLCNPFQTLYDEDVRIFREGKLPMIEKVSASEFSDEINNSVYKTFALKIAQSGDLAYTYGIGKVKAANKDERQKQFSYLRIWKKKVKDWQIVLEVTNNFK